jgi:hypothetical protein
MINYTWAIGISQQLTELVEVYDSIWSKLGATSINWACPLNNLTTRREIVKRK